MKNRLIVLGLSAVIAVLIIVLGVQLSGSNTTDKSGAGKETKVASIDDDEKKDNGKENDTTSEGETNSQEGANSEDKTTSEGETNSQEGANSEDKTTSEGETTSQGETASEGKTTAQGETTGANEETTASPSVQNPVNGTIDPAKPMVALTFDDGPAGAKTSRLLDCLEQYGARATFFVVGTNIEGNEDIIRRAASIGCEIGNHSYDHANLVNLDEKGINDEVRGVDEVIKNLTGQPAVVCRPPYGSFNDTVAQVVNEPIILWSIDTLDWKTRNAASTVQSIQSSVGDGDVILMHDIHAESIDAAVEIIPWLVNNGYQLVTVSELGYYKKGGLQNGVRYGSMY